MFLQMDSRCVKISGGDACGPLSPSNGPNFCGLSHRCVVLYADIGQSNEDSSCYFKLQPLFFMRTLSALSVLLSFSVLIILIVAGLIGFLKGHYSS